MAIYQNLSKEIENKIILDEKNNTRPNFGYTEKEPLRRIENEHDKSSVWRTAFIRDIDKIMHCPYYNRYADKTQVFSLYKNDDITHRALHVQLVSRIARTIGRVLNLNLDLIEAIALGHDIGHTPFGHTGEKFLDELSYSHTGRRFAHNVHSVRVLDKIFPLNLSLPTLSGIISHNGELELSEYRPKAVNSFEEFDRDTEKCYLDVEHVKKLLPSTLEGCVMRISDIIAYLGKDRHDAEYNDIAKYEDFSDSGIGKINAEILNNLITNIIEHSYGHNYIKMDSEHFSALQKAKKENYARIYGNSKVTESDETLKSMMEVVYEKLLRDLKNGIQSSPIFTHHVAYVDKPYYKNKREIPYTETENNQIVIDYIASMTDDYFIELHSELFPKSTKKLKYIGYFD